LLRLGLSILFPYFLNSFPGIVVPEGLSHDDGLQTELVDGTPAFKGLASQFPVDFGWNTDKDPSGVIPRVILLLVNNDSILPC
jgi:hypothetical protein